MSTDVVLPTAAGSSGRYSHALYNAAVKLDVLDTVSNDVDRMQSMRESSDELDQFFRNPSLPRSAKRDTLEAIMAADGSFSTTFQHFMYVLAENGRTPESGRILADFQEIIKAIKGEVIVKVTSAVEFSEWELAFLKKKIKENFFKDSAKAAEVSVETAIDPELLGGMTLQVGDRFMDLSTRTELRKVQEEILKSVA